MSGERAVGNSYENIINALCSGTLSHAVFLHGDKLVCRDIFISACSQVCGKSAEAVLRSPGVFVYDGDKKKFFVHNVEELIAEMACPPLTPRRMIYIYNAGNMSETVQNKLLKTFEDPLPNNQFVLSGIEGNVLPTLYSRCMHLRAVLGSHFANNLADYLVEVCRRLGTELSRDTAMSCIEIADGSLDEAYSIATDESVAGLYSCAFNFACVPSMYSVFDAPEDFYASRENAHIVLSVFIRCFSDMLRIVEGAAAHTFTSSNRLAVVAGRASALSRSELIGVIELCSAAQKRISTNASAKQTFDNLLAKTHVFMVR